MKKTAIVLGLLGSLAQLSIVMSPSVFVLSSPPPAAIILALVSLGGAVVAFWKLKLGGILMLMSAPVCFFITVAAAMQQVDAGAGTEAHGASRNILFAVVLLLVGFVAVLVVAAGIFALIPRKDRTKLPSP